ncbi:MAG: glutamine--fructose-6-phosphate transaminase (isomerizing) [Planctomycetota bacterium]|jgi:glucosamine--fructose-6-phosphate aminotransferase (isomerizing)
MSGIVGCIGKGDVPGLVLQGLNRLEYLGYDSAGLAVLQNGKLQYEKLSGDVRLLSSRVSQSGLTGDTGIGCLRFATHGDPTRANAHPQLSCKSDVAVVLDGVIENFKEVKKRLLAQGHRFRSQTDAEVVAHLLEGRLSEDGFLEVIQEVLNVLEGSFSFLVVDPGRPDEIFGACAESALWVGTGKNITVISSHLAPLIVHSRKAVRLEAGSVVRVRKDGVDTFQRDGSRTQGRAEEIGLTLAQAQREGYDFHSLKEIHEQPIVIRRAFSARIGGKGVRLRNFGLSRRTLKECDIVRAIGSGSSYHAALLAKNSIEELVRIPTSALPSSELLSGDPVVTERSLLLAFSQSGKTTETVLASRMWRRRGGRVLVISNTPGSPLWKEGDGTLGTYAGPEIGMVSTKTYTASLVVSYLFAITLGRAKGVVKSVPERELLYGLERLPEAVEALLRRSDEIDRIADRFMDVSSAFFTGFGFHFPSALEGALKMKQWASIHTEGIPVGEIKHQALNLVSPERPVVALAFKGPGYDAILAAVRRIRKVDGVVIAFTDDDDGEIASAANEVFHLSSVGGFLTPVPTTVVLQLLAVAVARKRGFDLDTPPKLRRYFG